MTSQPGASSWRSCAAVAQPALPGVGNASFGVRRPDITWARQALAGLAAPPEVEAAPRHTRGRKRAG